MPPSSVPAQHKRLVIASANPGKVSEFRNLLADLPFELTSLGELGLTAAELTAADKNRRSHRGIASAALLRALCGLS